MGVSLLNPSQQTAVITTEGPLLVLAGAGSGKTRVLISRIGHLIEQGIDPGKILAITFTKKAAGEMRERLSAQVGTSTARMSTVTTFHSLGADMVREFVVHSGLRPKFSISDESEGANRARYVLKSQGMPLNAPGERPRELVERLGRAKVLLTNELVKEGMGRDLLKVLRTGDRNIWAAQAEELAYPDLDRFTGQYEAYQDHLLAQNIVEYEDLLVLPLVMCLSKADTLRAWAGRWEYILVDEYQDTDYVQDHILRLLSREHRNLCAVGDQNQAIYSWRGAKIENIRTFAERYAPCQVVALADNYRSTPEILEAANVALKSRGQANALMGGLRSVKPSGELVRVWQSTTSDIESAIVVRDMRKALADHSIRSWSDVFILYRLNGAARNLEVALKRAGIPYKIANGYALHERHDARIILAYLRLVENPFDMAAFETAITHPARGVGSGTIEKLKARARALVIPILDLVMTPEAMGGIKPGQTERLLELRELVREIDEVINGATVAAGVQVLVERLDSRRQLVTAMAQAEEADDDEAADDAERQMADLEDFLLYVEEFIARRPEAAQRLELFLDDVFVRGAGDEIVAAGDVSDECVTLMSIHAAKGLEARRVYVIGLEEGVFPVDCSRGGDAEELLGEEARLFYVALTRAEDHLVLSSARTREVRRGDIRPMMASRFLSDLPETAYRFEIYSTDTTEISQ